MKKFDDFWKRVVASTFIVALFILSLYFSTDPVGRIAFFLFVALSGVFASYEYMTIVSSKGFIINRYIVILGMAFGLFAFFYEAQYSDSSVLALLLFYLYLLATFLFHFQQTESSIAQIAISCFPILYLAIPLGLSFYILFNHPEGKWWIAYLILVTKMADVGGYFGGKLFGRNKLTSSISPNKTYEGFFSALLFALVSSSLISIYATSFILLPLVYAILLGLILGVIGQFGDLCESLLKRDAKVKDSSSLPGIGGVLDLLDSILLNIPVIYFYLSWFDL